jgi:predicted nucleic acid-binding Zn ribbon protein
MPLYTFENKKTGKEFTEMMTISEMENYLLKNKHIRQIINAVNIVAGVSGMSYRSDGGWKDNLSRIAEAHPNSPLAQQHKKKSVKEVKTEQAVKKYKARQIAKNK